MFGQIFAEVDLRDSEDLRTDVYGAISLIFWTLTLIALFKYVFVVLRANDTGEGAQSVGMVVMVVVMGRGHKAGDSLTGERSLSWWNATEDGGYNLAMAAKY